MGRTIEECALAARLDRLGYRRVHARPDEPGEYFWGNDVFWFHRRACRVAGDDEAVRLVGLTLRAPRSTIGGAVDAKGAAMALGDAFLEPETLAESLDASRAVRRLVPLGELPEHAWRAVLAAEDARFTEHAGVEARSVLRAVIANVRRGGIAQGGSTITQQLVKNRDLTPKRTMGRKLSEAVRAVALEAEYSKDDILEAYMDSVYLGHVDGLAVHGFGAAARAYFSKDARELSLAESALLAGMIQGPNRLAPERHPEAARERRDRVLSRMEELEWIPPESARAARAKGLSLRESPPPRPAAARFVAWAGNIAREESPDRIEDRRGVVIETSLDPWLQARAEDIVAEHLAALRRDHRSLRRAPLSAALVVIDASSGDVLAHVGGDPLASDAFDRVRLARRQPGSTIKPLVLLEALEGCGGEPLMASTRVADEPLRIVVPDGAWEPSNSDDSFRGVVTLREALVQSLNVPIVRIARHCGFEATQQRVRLLGIDLPPGAPPSFVLGAAETSPLELARAYASVASLGELPEIRPVRRVERPGGRGIETFEPRSERVASPSTAFVLADILEDAVRRGTAASADIAGVREGCKTGTSSERRDAWLAGFANGLVAVAWVGLDDGAPLGLSGADAAAPPWREVMSAAVGTRPARDPAIPDDVLLRHVNPEGLLVPEDSSRGRPEFYRRGVTPRRARWWRDDDPDRIVN